ncbi:gamma-glutamyltransferase [Pseudoxanthomonas broegbernensis]|uniref:Gamma-glutamyltransferase n=2 Tax=Pseudoxanthomonas broegbernensis TaxID=83619 RepID=A0A7V8GKB6_9GAMM|nr:gamma-glutamyltransferase [Pseudoxanthomonas broegbernensis]
MPAASLRRLAAWALSATVLGAALAASPAPASAHASGERAIVVAAHPLAVDAGVAVLQRGGSAMDAAVAVQAMLGLVEPQSSGIGGGAIIMAYAADSGETTVYIGREAAPAAAIPALLDDARGNPLPRAEAMLTGRATGVPGAVAAFAQAHRAHGKLAWNRLFDESIARAEAGFRITPRLARHIHGSFPQAAAPDVRAYFSDASGRPLRSGDLLRNPAYAATLRVLAEGGADAFYRGPLTPAIVARTRDAPMPGAMTADDLDRYRPERASPLCRPLRRHVLCVPPPPASGVGLLQLMALLEATDIDARGPDDPQAWFLFAEASRLMYADRDHYVGDPRFTAVPVAGLLAPDYVRARAGLIGARAAAAPPAPGRPEGAPHPAPDATDEPGGTSHFVVVDGDGNAVSVTTTVESFFGSGRMVGGFFLNNQLTDFAWDGEHGRAGMANAIAPGKRPRSSMTPALLLDADGRLAGALGSPGGSAIPAYVGKALVGLLHWGMPLPEAIALPNLVARGTRFDGEAGRFAPPVLAALRERGIDIRPGAGEDSGLHGVFLRDGRWEWGADPRREGTAAFPLR